MERDTKGRFVKGHECASRNGGRPKGLAERCRAAVNDGGDVIDLMLAVLRGEVEDCRTSDRIDAARWFAERGWGKAINMTADVSDIVKVYEGIDIERI